MSFRLWLLFVFLFQMQRIEATDRTPWLGNLFEFQWDNQLRTQNYRSIASGGHLIHDTSSDFFYTMGLSNVIFDYGIELEGTFAWTGHQKGDLDQFKITGRHVLLDDVAGDPISFAIGVSLIKACWHSLKDKSSFHHGLGEAELFVSFGKEHSFRDSWCHRWWGVLGMGIAERGSPWFRGQVNYEVRFKEHHEFKVFVDLLGGLGRKQLHKHDFKGYGPIAHQSVDLGGRYAYLFENEGVLSVAYAFRVYARNFPAYAHNVCIEYIYPFGL